jgi:hypothetical protein
VFTVQKAVGLYAWQDVSWKKAGRSAMYIGTNWNAAKRAMEHIIKHRTMTCMAAKVWVVEERTGRDVSEVRT